MQTQKNKSEPELNWCGISDGIVTEQHKQQQSNRGAANIIIPIRALFINVQCIPIGYVYDGRQEEVGKVQQ